MKRPFKSDYLNLRTSDHVDLGVPSHQAGLVMTNENIFKLMKTIFLLVACATLFCALFTSCITEANKGNIIPGAPKHIYPNVWGAKQIFAYSGLEGETSFKEPFTGVIIPDKLGFRIGNHDHYLTNLSHKKFTNSRPVWIDLKVGDKLYSSLGNNTANSYDSLSCKIVASNVIDVCAYADGVAVSFSLLHADRSRMVGKLQLSGKNKKPIQLIINHPYLKDGKWDNNRLVYKNDQYLTAFSLHKGEWSYLDGKIYSDKISLNDDDFEISFDLAMSYSGKSTSFDLKSNWFDEQLSTQAKVYEDVNLDWIPNEELARTYLKAYSVMRGNTETAQGIIDYQWTTPDRTPHKKMWLWDSGFHAIGLRHFDNTWAEEAIKAMLSVQHDDGFLTISTTPYQPSDITQPPVLAFACWKVYEKSQNIEFLKYCYPKLIAYLDWNYKNRDRDGNGLMEWHSGDESGMDNSPRFDQRKYMDAVDFNCFVANEWHYLTKIASLLGKETEASDFTKREKLISEKINQLLWDEEKQMYYDRYIETGVLSDVEAISSFLPLFANVASSKQAEALIQEFTDNNKWWTPLPGPSISKTHSSFGSNMWRGPVWINYSYLTYEGLKNYGKEEEARKLAEATVQQISHWYHKEGTIFEFFDPMAEKSPQKLPRKKSLGCIHEFGWSCTLYMELLNDLYN
ncbi:MAG: trehalase family glycosidase [Carboxylicivirga sp.]|jgi:hypothetical protein|nr:trehalase family glycosidase [Carboxylicivirga sp.]